MCKLPEVKAEIEGQMSIQAWSMRTRCKDKNGNPIYEGDILYVEEYPDKYVGGSLSFEGVVRIENGKAYVTYYDIDIGEEESYPITMFPIRGREIMS